MARRPAPSARSTRGPRRSPRDAGGSGRGPANGEPEGRLDPQQRLAALLARGYADAPPVGSVGSLGSAATLEGPGWDEEGEDGDGEGGDEEDGDRGRGGADWEGRGGRRSVAEGSRGRHRRRTEREERPAPALWSLPSSLVDARRAVSWRAVAAVAVLVALAGGVFAVRVGSARASAQPQTAVAAEPLTRTGTPPAFASGSASPRPSTSRASGGGAAAATSTAATAVTTAAAELVVDVAGQVVRPGVVRLPAGSRVADALARAGGAGAGADLSVVNLARPLVDGERLYVPRPGETPPTVLGPVVGSGAGTGGGTGGGSPGGTADGGAGSGGGSSAPGAPVDLNRADLAALDALPGVGPVLAQRILDWRGQHGRFSSVDELGEVSGIGDKLLGTLRPLVTV